MIICGFIQMNLGSRAFMEVELPLVAASLWLEALAFESVCDEAKLEYKKMAIS